MRSIWRLVAILAFANLNCSNCLATDHVVYVHIVDAKNGNPILRGNLEMRWNRPREHVQVLKEKIGSDGVATFHIADPLPAQFPIRLGRSMGYWYPCSIGSYETDETLEHGVSEQADIWPKTKLPNISDKFHPKPGEIYFFACHIPLGEYFKTWLKGFK